MMTMLPSWIPIIALLAAVTYDVAAFPNYSFSVSIRHHVRTRDGKQKHVPPLSSPLYYNKRSKNNQYQEEDQNNNYNNYYNPIPITNSITDRRGWITRIITQQTIQLTSAITILSSSSASPKQAAQALVDVDPDRYGDKELKIATITKVRQNIHDLILQDPTLVSLFVQIAIQDALTYNEITDDGGLDGTIVPIILNLNTNSSSSSSLVYLKPAAQALQDLQIRLRKTTEITMADLVVLAGAEAIEAAGGPRVVVQLGRITPTTSTSTSTSTSSISSYPDLRGNKQINNDGGKSIIEAFQKAGLSERDVALHYGLLATLDQVVNNRKKGGTNSSSSSNEDEDDDEVNEMGEREVYFPPSFGGPTEIYGKQLETNCKFNAMAMFSTIVNNNNNNSNNNSKKATTSISTTTMIPNVFENEIVFQWAEKYSSSNTKNNKNNKNANFTKDFPLAYTRLMSLGVRYTGGKVDDLLGN